MGKRFNPRDRAAVLHFLTLQVRDRCRAFTHAAYAVPVLQQLRTECDTHPARLIAYVAMPDHLHCICNPRDGEINRFLSRFKAASTLAVAEVARQRQDTAVLAWLQQTPDGHQQLWQDGKHDFHLYSSRVIWQKIDYIHNNPLRAGLAHQAAAYRFSSFPAMYQPDTPPLIALDREFWWELSEQEMC